MVPGLTSAAEKGGGGGGGGVAGDGAGGGVGGVGCESSPSRPRPQRRPNVQRPRVQMIQSGSPTTIAIFRTTRPKVSSAPSAPITSPPTSSTRKIGSPNRNN